MTIQSSPADMLAASSRSDGSWSVRLLQSGKLQDRTHAGKPWKTAIYKLPLSEPVVVGQYGIVGDEHTASEPDPDRALSCHPLGHYTYWSSYFRTSLPPGSFGENLTLDGLAEEDLCIGDVLRCGSVLLQISQPRMPCDGPARRIGQPDLVKLILQTGKLGWMARVLEPGTMQVGNTLTLIERPHPEIPLPFVMYVFHTRDARAAAELAAQPLLASEWRSGLACRTMLSYDEPAGRRRRDSVPARRMVGESVPSYVRVQVQPARKSSDRRIAPVRSSCKKLTGESECTTIK